MRPRQNACYFAGNISLYILLNRYIFVLTEISLKLIPEGSINNEPALTHMMAWHLTGEKPSYWTSDNLDSDAYTQHLS